MQNPAFTRNIIASGALLLSLLFSPLLSAEIQGFQDFNGKAKTIEDFTGKGKWLVVMFWASDCHICNKEAHQYVDFHMVHSDKDATVLGVSLDGAEGKKAAEKFIQRHNIDFPNLIAEPETVSDIYSHLTGAYFAGTPSFLIFGPKGELLAAQAGAVPTRLIEDFIEKTSQQAATQ